MNNENYVFGLDIGTRSVVGSVGYLERGKFHVAAHYVKEHETRAMMDGQIHDIQKVGETIGMVKHELEKQLGGQALKEVSIAAAGRLLQTVTVHVEMTRSDDLPITSEDIYSLDSLGIEQAYEIIRSKNSETNFYCVGYTVVKYYMNDYVIQNLEGQKAKQIAADVLATFLPNDVVEGLYAAVETANLNVASMTLEPIAAMNVAIPEQFRLLNICLVDVGAGTSDLCITKDGSIVAYGMIPHAGDEITESIVHQCLVEFKVAEQIKRASLGEEDITYFDIMGLEQTISAADARALYADTVDRMTKEIAEKIKELNGGKSVSAIFVVGGGGKAYQFTEKLAEYSGIQKQRVALRGKEVLGDVEFHMENVEKDPLLVTPIGICINYYSQKNNFIFVNINDIRIKLYDNDHLTVVDAAAQTGFPNEGLFAKRGDELTFTINGNTKMMRGQIGEPALITINGQVANFNSHISANDKIVIKESTKGAAAFCKIENLAEYKKNLKFIVNNKEMVCPKFVTVNGELVTGSYSIQNGDEVKIMDYYTTEQLLQFMDINPEKQSVIVNHHVADLHEPIYENFQIEVKNKEEVMKNFKSQIQKPSFYEPTKTYEEPVYESVSMKVEDMMEENDTELDEDEDSAVIYTSRNPEAAKKVNAALRFESEDKKEEESLFVPAKTEEAPAQQVKRNIIVAINGTPVTLSGKASYVFVDIFDFYAFDTSRVRGDELVTNINGTHCTYGQALHDGDSVEIYWRNHDK